MTREDDPVPEPPAGCRARFFDASPDICCVVGADGFLCAVNAVGAEALAWTPPLFRTRLWLDLLHPDDRAAALAALGDGSTEARFAARCRDRSGEWRALDWRATRRTEDGSLFAAAREPETGHGAVEDVAGRASAAALAAVNSRLEATLAAIPDLLFEFDADLRYVAVRSGDPDLLAAPRAALLGRTLGEALPPDAAAICLGVIDEVRATGRSFGRRYALPIEGEARWFEVSASRRPADALDARPGVLMLIRDITERVRQEAALAAARAAAEAANAAKSDFLASMSHEIRTPMNGVLGMADVLARAVSDPEHRRMVEVIRQSGALLLDVINDILDLSKIDAGRMELENTPFSPADLARTIEAVYTLKASSKEIGFSMTVAPGAAQPRLGDSHRLAQILHNVVGNAMKFTERGAVAVRFGGAPPDPLWIEVRDTGVGMTDEQIARVFEPFGQADATVTRRFGGTGLGMSIVRRLVDLMGGAIAVESAPGQGTTVRLSLPLAPTAAPAPAAAVAPEAVAPLDLSALAADDNEINRIVLEALLAGLGVRATIVDGGAEAISRFAAEAFDVLLLDISMPEVDGFEALARIRADEAGRGLRRTPAVAVTAHAMKPQVDACLARGFDAHVAKPLSPATLADAIRRACAER